MSILVTSGHALLSDEDIPDDGRFVSKPYDLKDVVVEIRAIIEAV